MALINCPECNNTVSDSAAACPHCGFAIRTAVNDTISILIENDPSFSGNAVVIKSAETGRELAYGECGSVVEIKSKTDCMISFCGVISNKVMLTTKVSPKNGGKYKATWGASLFASKIVACTKVDSF